MCSFIQFTNDGTQSVFFCGYIVDKNMFKKKKSVQPEPDMHCASDSETDFVSSN